MRVELNSNRNLYLVKHQCSESTDHKVPAKDRNNSDTSVVESVLSTEAVK